MAIIHFKSQKERLDYLKGKYEEIVPVVAEQKTVENEKKSQKKTAKSKKTTKKSKAEDEK